MNKLFLVFLLFTFRISYSQFSVSLKISDGGELIRGAIIFVQNSGEVFYSDTNGIADFKTPIEKWTINIVASGFVPVLYKGKGSLISEVILKKSSHQLNEIIVTGFSKEMKKSESPVPVEVYSGAYFDKAQVTTLYDAFKLINGIQANIDDNVSGSGDIEINGNEGQYTLVLLDGVPLLNGLKALWGFSSFPMNIIDRIEVLKGPSSTLYGSDAIAGVVNIITKNPLKKSEWRAELLTNSYLESQASLYKSFRTENFGGLINFSYNNQPLKWDLNKDGFMDIPILNRFNVFAKTATKNGKFGELVTFADYMFEERYSGVLRYGKHLLGSSYSYGVFVKTNQTSISVKYKFPGKENIQMLGSFGYVGVNSWFANYYWKALQKNSFVEMKWQKDIKSNFFISLGFQYRYINFDDNRAGTRLEDGSNAPLVYHQPALYAEAVLTLASQHKILAGLRYEYDLLFKNNIVAPRLYYNWFSENKKSSIRLGGGYGYRIPTVFNDEFSALSSGRVLEIEGDLKTETCWGGTLNYAQTFEMKFGTLDIDAGLFFNYIKNAVEADLDEPGVVVFENEEGYAFSQGIQLNVEYTFAFPLKAIVGFTLMDFNFYEADADGNVEKERPKNSPHFYSTFNLSYSIPNSGFSIDWGGNVVSPMRLAVQSNDYRPEYSKWFTIQNIQFRQKIRKHFEIFGGILNIFNFVNKYPLMRPFDPFNKEADNVTTNPNGWRFDSSYTYAPVQGIRGFLGIRYFY